MTRQFTADGFYTGQGFGAPDEARPARLIDLDLTRGNTAGELVTQSGTPGEIIDFHPVVRAGQPNFFETVSGEVTTTVSFKDGAELSGVLALLVFASFSSGATISQFLFDQGALAAVGKTVADIASARSDGAVDHSLSWADLGFAPAAAPLPTTATATYFRQSSVTGGTGCRIAGLIDNDLLRDRDAGEAVDLGFGERPTGGSPQGFGEGSQQKRADVTFQEVTMLSGVDGLFTAFLIAAVGKTVTGTARADVLVGTSGADLMRGVDGNDRLTGRAPLLSSLAPMREMATATRSPMSKRPGTGSSSRRQPRSASATPPPSSRWKVTATPSRC